MKKGIHPNVNKEAAVTCVCGNKFTTISTLPIIQVDICSNCHPFFTGQQKYIDTQGQVEKFGKRGALAEVKKAERAKITAVRASKVQKQTTEKKSLKDLLLQARKNVAS